MSDHTPGQQDIPDELRDALDQMGKSMPSYGFDGEPISGSQFFVDKFTSGTNVHVGDDQVGARRVSTVWLGLGQGTAPDGRPLIFETGVFDADGEFTCVDRYPDQESAADGHVRVLEAERARQHGA